MESNFFFNSIGKKAIDTIRDKNKSLDYYARMMLTRTQEMFKWENLPDTIPQRMLEMQLQTNGYTLFTYNEKPYVYYGGLGGDPDVYYRPTIYTISNPYQHFNKMVKIDYDKSGKGDGILILNDSMLLGLMPLISRYGSMLVESDISMIVAMINQRLISIMTANDGNTKAACEEFMKKIIAGDLTAVIQDEKGFMDEQNFRTNPYATSGNNNTLSQLIENNHYIFANLCRELGINENYNGKRESITSSESELSEDFTHTLVDNMLSCRKLACEEINHKYGLNLNVELSGVWKQNAMEAMAELEELSNNKSEQEEQEEKEEDKNGLQDNQ